MDLSIVVPLLNEAESLLELEQWIASSLQGDFEYEILFIDDGSTDNSWDIIEKLAQKSTVKAVKFSTNFGKSQALHAGFKEAQGKVVVTLDADLQDSPEEIPALFQMINEEDFDLVSGWKKKRFDNLWAKNIPSKIFNWAARKTSGVKLHDFNCGIKAFKKEVIKNIEVNGEMHRYIPVLAHNAGYNKIGEKIVKHQARKYGKTKFGYNRFIHGFLDLITIWFITKFGKSPMHLFGSLGVLMFFVGILISLCLGLDKLFFNPQGSLLTDRPYFYIALTTMIIGVQFFIAGFLGELISRSKEGAPKYVIQKKISI